MTYFVGTTFGIINYVVFKKTFWHPELSKLVLRHFWQSSSVTRNGGYVCVFHVVWAVSEIEIFFFSFHRPQREKTNWRFNSHFIPEDVELLYEIDYGALKCRAGKYFIDQTTLNLLESKMKSSSSSVLWNHFWIDIRKRCLQQTTSQALNISLTSQWSIFPSTKPLSRLWQSILLIITSCVPFQEHNPRYLRLNSNH